MAEICIEYPPRLDLFLGPHQHHRNTFQHIKHDLPYIFRKKMIFLLHNVSRILSRRSGYYSIDIFSNETWMAVSISEASSAPKGMKC